MEGLQVAWPGNRLSKRWQYANLSYGACVRLFFEAVCDSPVCALVA